MYYFETQFGGSYTKDSLRLGTSDARTSPVWKAELDRTGRLWGFNYLFSGLGTDFISRSGFVPRTGIITLHGFNRFSYYGKPGARLENITMFFGPSRIWQYDNFALADAYEGQESISNMFRLRGGWNGSLNHRGTSSRSTRRLQRPVHRRSGWTATVPSTRDPSPGLMDVANGHDADVSKVQRNDDDRAERGGDLREGRRGGSFERRRA
jgi:hypothetical protein